MIVSHRFQFVFVHCRKVAGSSMKLAMSPYLGDEDMVVGSLDEMLDAHIRPTAAMQRVLDLPAVRLMTTAARLSGFPPNRAKSIAYKRALRGVLGENPPHPPASRAIDWVGERRWTTYTKFCFVRNPYRQVVSDYLWIGRNTRTKFSFTTYLRALAAPDARSRILPSGWVRNWDMISVDGKLAVDFVGRFENMEDDFASITSRLGLGRLEIAGISAKKSPTYDYRSFYSDEDVELVTGLFREEIEEFGYSYSNDT